MIPDDNDTYLEVARDAQAATVTRPCASCPKAQFGSRGRGQACKQMVRLAMYVPTASDYAPWLKNLAVGDDLPPPVLLSFAPTNLKDWDAYITWVQSIKFPMEGIWTAVSGASVSVGGYTVGKFTLKGNPIVDKQYKPFYDEAIETMKHPLVAQLSEVTSEDYQKQDDSAVGVTGDGTSGSSAGDSPYRDEEDIPF